MTSKLSIVSGPDSGRVFELQAGSVLVIGRGSSSDTKIQDPRISRVHCRIEWSGERAILVDQESSTGTLVEGRRVERLELGPGTAFQIGDTILRLDVSPQDQPTVIDPVLPAKLPRMADLMGQVLGTFRLEKIVTATHSGMIFRGCDTKRNKPVAVKVLAPDLARLDEQKDRFVRAMNTILSIRHENIIRVYNAGKAGPYCWAAMEWIDGESLDQVIDRLGIDGMLDWREAWRVAVHVGRALEFAAEKKIIHRNLTPRNIIRRREDKVCLLGDLMLAKALDGTYAAAITQPGQLIGDVAYMSPERTLPHGCIDGRSDLYGLGATLYALLTGRPPFEADTLVDLVRLVRDQLPKPPRDFQFSVNGVFEDVVMKLLSKRPESRYQVPGELLRDLERIGSFSDLDADANPWI